MCIDIIESGLINLTLDGITEVIKGNSEKADGIKTAIGFILLGTAVAAGYKLAKGE